MKKKLLNSARFVLYRIVQGSKIYKNIFKRAVNFQPKIPCVLSTDTSVLFNFALRAFGEDSLGQ